MKVKTLLCICALLFSLAVAAQSPQPERYPKREFRAAWIQAVNGQFRGIPTEKLKQTLLDQLNSLQGAGINAIIFQVRPEADALYASKLEPWSRFLTGVQGKAPNPYWDPMEFMIEECHKRGMEFHAWINPYRVKTSLKNELAPNHVYNIHPEWFVTYGDQLYFDPALPESRRHICMVVMDIVSRYDVDAIQEAIAKAFDKIGTLKQDTYAKTWLLRILINECYGIMRKEKKIISLETCEQEEPWMERQDYSDLYEALMGLTEETRLTVTLYYMEGYNIREIARMTKVTESAVKSRLARARTKLKEELSKEG